MTGNRAIDTGDLRKYRIEIPNLIDDFGLSVYAFRLYVHLKRVAGASEDGACWQSTRTLSKICKMSVGKISEAKQELADANLVSIQRRDTKRGETDFITIVDVWPQNFTQYSCSHDEQPVHVVNTPVHVVNTPVHVVNTPVHVVKQRSNQSKKEPMKKASSPLESSGSELPEAYWLYEQVFAYPPFGIHGRPEQRERALKQLEGISTRYSKDQILAVFEIVRDRDVEHMAQGKKQIGDKLAYALSILEQDVMPKPKRVKVAVKLHDPFSNSVIESVEEMTIEQAQRNNLQILEYLP